MVRGSIHKINLSLLYNIIFLEIDGVLNTRNHLRQQYKQAGETDISNWCPKACKYISLICDQFNTRIVISSTWRYDHSLSELRNIFKNNGISPGYIVDTTPALIYEEESADFCRGDDINC